MNSPTLLILAAGIGSRYGGLKQMEPVGPAGEIVLDYSIFDALRAGFGRVVFVIRRELEEAFRKRIGERWETRVPCAYVFQELADIPPGGIVPPDRIKPWGTAHAIRAARGIVGEPFAVINADDFYGAASFQVLAEQLRSERDPNAHCMVAFRLDQTLSEHGSVSRGVCRCSPDQRLLGIHEYTRITRRPDGTLWNEPADGPAVPLSGIEPVSMNCWGFQPAFFAELDAAFECFFREGGQDLARKEFTIPAVVDEMIRSGRGIVRVLRTPAQWAGVTYREDKGQVEAAIRAHIAAGEYPPAL